jgi:alpha-amylase
VLPETTYNKTVTFKSSDETVAKVDNAGKVTALKTGECTVTATASDGKTVAECKIKVVVAAEKITLNSTLITIEKGKSITLKASVLPETATDKTVTWTSSDETVAKVDKNGKVTTLKAGKAVIKASSSTEGVFAECTVNVKVDSTEIKLRKRELKRLRSL